MIEARPRRWPTSPRPIHCHGIAAGRPPEVGPCAAPRRCPDSRAEKTRGRRPYRRRAPPRPAEARCRDRLKCRSFGSPIIYVRTAVSEVPDEGVGIVAATYALEALRVAPTTGPIVEQDVPVRGRSIRESANAVALRASLPSLVVHDSLRDFRAREKAHQPGGPRTGGRNAER